MPTDLNSRSCWFLIPSHRNSSFSNFLDALRSWNAAFCMAGSSMVPAFFGMSAQAEMLPLGRASTGVTITLNTDSIPRMSRRSANSGTLFTYYLGNERIDAEAICTRGIWTIDGQEYKPQSQATHNMVSMACSLRFESGEDMETVLVFDL
jgi:hypothetical protein